MATENPPQGSETTANIPARRGPSSTEILEFAKRTGVINTNVSIGTLLENTSVLRVSDEVSLHIVGVNEYGLVTP
jgi:hypothetical protein